MYRSAVVLTRFLHTGPIVFRGFKPGRGTGDKGSSSLFNNERRWKDDEAFHALGNTDELSSFLGICREHSSEDCLEDVTELITRIQCILQDLGSHVATPPNSSKKKQERTVFDEKFVKYVDGLIDEFGDKTPTIRQFILPGGGPLGSHLQYARALCRRAERSLVPLVRDEAIDENALKFLNRLSDLLFVLGRYACLKTHNYELSYLPPLKNVEQEADVKATKLIDKKKEES
uniref:Corrinoid adenosyltransferase MMAB n=1 Tax=Panagrolaimus superbus TaxID=310955 RepID=A0A914ZBB8_9BILA